MAKSVARSLNNRQIGGKRSKYYYHDIWNLKYLSGFKWRHLTEKISYERRLREQKLRAEVNSARRANNAFVAQVERAREIQRWRRKTAKPSSNGSIDINRSRLTEFRQNKPVEANRVRNNSQTRS